MKEILILKENTKDKITDAKDLFNKVKKIKIDYKQENFIAVYLSTQNIVLGCDVLFKGGLNACLVCPKTLFRTALKHNSDKIIIAHNHPSNDLKPSYEDREMFKQLKDAGEIIDIKVLDSIIFNKKEFYSLTDGGLKWLKDI